MKLAIIFLALLAILRTLDLLIHWSGVLAAN